VVEMGVLDDETADLLLANPEGAALGKESGTM
jgi:hypothetical protein